MKPNHYDYQEANQAPTSSRGSISNVTNEEKLKKSTDKKLYRRSVQKRICKSCDAARFQDWLLEEGKQTTPSQEGIIRRRYLDMIHKELDKINEVPERRSILYTRKDQAHLDCPRNKRELLKRIEEEWKTKEMVMLNKIREDIRREAKLEEQRRLQKEMNEKKLAFQQKKKAYYLKVTQSRESKRQATAEMKGGQNEPASTSKTKNYITNDQKTYQGYRVTKRSVPQSKCNTKNAFKRSPAFLPPPHHISQTNTRELQANREFERPYRLTTREITTPMMHMPREPLPHISKQMERHVNLDEENRKRQGDIHDSVPVEFKITSYPTTSYEQHPSCCQDHQVKVTSEELHSIIHNVMTWVVSSVTNILYPVITKYERQMNITSLEFKLITEYTDTDSLPFASIIEEMKKCSDIITNMMSSMVCQGSHTEKEPDELKALPSDILEMVIVNTKTELEDEEMSPGYEFTDVTSRLSDEIITQFYKHEIRLAPVKPLEEVGSQEKDQATGVKHGSVATTFRATSLILTREFARERIPINFPVNLFFPLCVVLFSPKTLHLVRKPRKAVVLHFTLEQLTGTAPSWTLCSSPPFLFLRPPPSGARSSLRLLWAKQPLDRPRSLHPRKQCMPRGRPPGGLGYYWSSM
ncbi:fibrous sheath-interacting protein 2-like [Dipodomys merriami]|uniref:fibrous sheath-interacting protein 2-like n=1 Tax=Dipodomys merriami TaxID=94247 RepID=UPI003855ACC8